MAFFVVGDVQRAREEVNQRSEKEIEIREETFPNMQASRLLRGGLEK